MDISIIDASKVSDKDGLIIGQDTAPVKIIEFMNVRCPYCKQWFEEHFEQLVESVNDGSVQRIIKLLDKEKESLQNGNLMHKYINYELPLKGLMDLRQMYATQNIWGNRTPEQVREFAQDNLELHEMDNAAVSQKVIEEAAAANIQFVPTVIVNNHIFDESISKETLLDYLNE